MQRYHTVLISTPWEHNKPSKSPICKRLLTRLLQRRQTSIHTEGKSTTHTTSRGNKNLCVYSVQRSNLAQRGTQDLAWSGTQEEQLRGETENRRWSEREKQKERKKQRFEGGVRERKREIDL